MLTTAIKRLLVFLTFAILLLLPQRGTAQQINLRTQTQGQLPAANGGVPVGGQTGYFLVKNSATDFDYSWARGYVLPAASPSALGGVYAKDCSTLGSSYVLQKINSDGTATCIQVTTGTLATVATSGNYNDLSNKPALGSLSAKNQATWSNDISGLPSTFPSDWNTTANKPVIPSKTSQLINDSGFLAAQLQADWNESTTGSADYIKNKPTLGALAAKTTADFSNDVTGKPSSYPSDWNTTANKPSLAAVATSGSYNDLTNKPTYVSSFNGRAGVVAPQSGDYTAAQVTNAAATNASNSFSGTQTFNNINVIGTCTGCGTGTSGSGSGVSSFNGRTGDVVPQAGDYQYSQISNTPVLATVATSGSYNDLNNKPTVPQEALNNAQTGITTKSTTGALANVTLISSVPLTGYYLVTAEVLETTAGVGCSGGAVSLQITYTHGLSNVAYSGMYVAMWAIGSTLSSSITQNMTVTTTAVGNATDWITARPLFIYAKTGTPISLSLYQITAESGCTTLPVLALAYHVEDY